MFQNKKKYLKLCLVMLLAISFGIVSAGFYRNLSADDEIYKGLRILFSDVIQLIEQNYVDPVDTKDMIQKAIQGMVHSLDPHSQFLPPEALEELRIDTRGEFGGIGIVITMQKGMLTVISPIEGTPAYNAGVQAGDIIVKVDGESTKDMMLWEAVKKMRGPKGQQVVITIVRKDEPEPMDFELVRDIIPIESIKHLVLKPGYGYVRITNFQENTIYDLKAALKNLESGDLPLKGLVLDLRDNPGGLLDQAIQVSELFLEQGEIIVSMKSRLKKYTKVYESRRRNKGRDYPIVILVNGGSASASEIVAGALQDHKRALILGTTSFGKGSVQTVESLRDGYGLKFTIARYYTPNGRSIQAQGIEPDIEVKHRFIDEEENGNGEDEDGLLKEKDLKNHLEAYPSEDEETEKDTEVKKDGKKKSPKRKTRSKYGPLNVEGLQEDNQVMHALKLLISYDIFKRVN